MPGDALDDRQTKAHAGVLGPYALGPAKKRLDKRGSQLWAQLLAGVLDREHHTRALHAGRDPHGAVFRQVVDDRVVHEVRHQLQVATADTSAHVSGDAVDIGGSDATAWLSAHGAEYGLCQIYRNEPWHYELRPEAVARGCPRVYADPTHDPRMQQ